VLIRAQSGNIYNLAHIEGIEVHSVHEAGTTVYQVVAHWEGHHEALSARGRPDTTSLVLARSANEEGANRIISI
jgi:hypothetical protein